MKIIVDFGISADGFIAKADGDSDWVAASTAPAFEARARGLGCVVVGRKTYEQYKGSIYPMEGTLNIVLSHTPGSDQGTLYVSSTQEAMAKAEEHGCTGILVAGGGQTAGTFLKAALLNEAFLTVHPLLLHEGIKPFGDLHKQNNLELVDSTQLDEGLIQLHYKFL